MNSAKKWVILHKGVLFGELFYKFYIVMD